MFHFFLLKKGIYCHIIIINTELYYIFNAEIEVISKLIN